MFVVTDNFTFDNITNSKYLKDNSTDDQYVRLDEWWLRVTFCVLMGFLSFWGTIGNVFVSWKNAAAVRLLTSVETTHYVKFQY